MMMFHSGIIWQYIVLNVLVVLQVVTPATVIQAGCYYWLMSNTYLSIQDRSGNITTRYFLWIVNPRYASPEEGLQNAASPSAFSQILSDQFHSLGQEPTVRLAGGQDSDNDDDLKSTVVYDSTTRIWNVSFEEMALFRYMGQHLLMSGSAICLYECAVADTMELIKLSSPVQYDDGGVQMTNPMERFYFIKEPCDKKTHLLLTSAGVFVSQDSLLSTQKLALQKLGNRQLTLSDAVILLMKYDSITQHIIIVTRDHTIFNLASDKFGTEPLKIDQIVNNALMMMTGVAASKWMCDLHTTDRQMMPIAFWNSSTIVVTDIRFKQFKQHVLPDSVTIKDVRFTGKRTTLGALVFDQATKKLSVLKVSQSTDIFNPLCFWTADTGTDKFKMIIAPVGVTAFYVWNDMVIYYYFGPENFGKLTIVGLPNDPIGTTSDPIKQFVITLRTEVAIALTSGAMFYSQVMFKEVWKLTMTMDPLSILSSDETGNFNTVKLDATLDLIRNPLDLSYQTVALENRNLKCPFKDFQISGHDMLNAFRMDIGEELRVWGLLMLPEGIDDDIIQVDLEQLDAVKADVTNEVHMEERGVSQLKEIQFSIIPEKAERFAHGNTYLGHYGFQLEPTSSDPGIVVCPLPRIMMGYIYVGCSDFKRVEIRRPKDNDEECEMFQGKTPYKYTLEGFQIKYPNGSQGTADKTIDYNFEKYGCPITMHFSEILLPELLLYDDLTHTVTPLNADFVIFEHHSRLFEYNNTAWGVRCSIPAQNWNEMAKSYNGTDMKYMWTPGNYRSCHSEPDPTKMELDQYGKVKVPNDVYQILNGSNMVGLTFTQTGSIGIYVFTAAVVDPHVSFCYLTVTFALNVVGKVVRKEYLGLYIAIGIYAVLLVVFVLATYFYYRNHVYGK